MTKTIFCIGIAGGSCSGKTRVVQQIIKDLNGRLSCSHISLDSYYKDKSFLSLEKRKLLNYDEPDAFDYKLLVNDLSKLLNNEEVSIPGYDFVTHTRKESTIINPSEVIIVEGLFALYFDELRKLYGLKVFIDASEKVRTDRRLERDTIERGRTKNEVINQLNETVLPMHNAWVESTKKFADLVVDSGKNDVRSCSNIILDYLSNNHSCFIK